MSDIYRIRLTNEKPSPPSCVSIIKVSYLFFWIFFFCLWTTKSSLNKSSNFIYDGISLRWVKRLLERSHCWMFRCKLSHECYIAKFSEMIIWETIVPLVYFQKYSPWNLYYSLHVLSGWLNKGSFIEEKFSFFCICIFYSTNLDHTQLSNLINKSTIV